MAIELDAAPTQPLLPEGLVVDEFQEEDAHAFHAAIIESFQDHWEWHGTPFEQWWETRRGQQADADGPLWFLVRDGDEIAGVVRNEAHRNGGRHVGAVRARPPLRRPGPRQAPL